MEEKEEKTENKGDEEKNGGVVLVKRAIVLGALVLLGGKFLFFYLENFERTKEKQRAVEGEKLRMAATALFKEKMASEEVDMLDIGLDIYWKDIGDTSHPFYGKCPSSWEAGGRIVGMVIGEEGNLLEITYEGPDKREEVWTMYERNGELVVEVVEN